MKYLYIYTKVRIPQKGTVRLKKEQLKNEKIIYIKNISVKELEDKT